MEAIGIVPLVDEPVSCSAIQFTAHGETRIIESEVQVESTLDVYINDIHTMKLGCSASDLVELVVGRLFTEGLVRSVDDIDAISICEHRVRADILLRNRDADLSRQTSYYVPTCCTQNQTLNSYFELETALYPVEPIAWDPEWIFRVSREFEADKTAHARTRGAHSAFLSTPERTLCVMEDIGRHNAFDKAIGWALLNDVDLTHCLIYTSGRVPTDMVTKAIRARIPILVSKAVATDKTVQIAREYGLTLICQAKGGSFELLR